MKLKKKETFSIENLSKDELLFLFEVIEKIELSSESTHLSFEIANKFRQFREEVFSTPSTHEEINHSLCEGCESNMDVSKQTCPVSETETLLCTNCFLFRKHHKDSLDAKQ